MVIQHTKNLNLSFNYSEAFSPVVADVIFIKYFIYPLQNEFFCTLFA